MGTPVTASLLLGVVFLAILPGFCILSFFNSILPQIPYSSVYSILLYFVQIVFILPTGFFCVMLYADIAFPLVMLAFGSILHRSAE